MDFLPSRILLASDGSEDAALAARAATELSGKIGAELHLVHAWRDPAPPVATSRVQPGRSPEWYVREARDLLTAQVRRVEEMGGTVAEAHLRNGPAVDEILDLGEELGVDLIVTGSRGLGTLGRLLMGSVSDGVANHATRSVLVLRGGERAWPPSRIVVGVDLHEESKGAARLGVELGKIFEAEVHLVLALPRFPQFSTQRVAARSEAWSSEEGVRLAGDALEDFAAELEGEKGGSLRSRAVVGEAATAILEAAEEGSERSLILTGGRDLGQLVRIRLGSVSSDVLRAADGPVLIHKRSAG